MPLQEDLTDQQFGRWTVIRKSDKRTKDGKRQPYWWCRCSCDSQTEREVFVGDLRRGAKDDRRGSLSCGCLMRELSGLRRTTHGMSYHPAYRSWLYMLQRCENPNNDGYELYGGRGIKVCDRWHDFALFWEDMGSNWREGLEIERKNVNGHYEPGNGSWATDKEQANNRRSNRTIDTPKGRMNITQAAELFGIDPGTVFSRISYGWDEADLLLPVRPNRMPPE